MIKRFGRASFALALTSLLTLAACNRLGLHRSSSEEPVAQASSAPIALGRARLTARLPGSPACRLVLDARALEQLRESARLRTPGFLVAQARADEALSKRLDSGYQGFQWADALASLSLLWHATSDPRYAQGALTYLNAMLDDRLVVGDGKGGADVVTHDSGYGMRTFGAYSALAYDWLRHAPGMTDEVRARVLVRLEQWIAWYQERGYLRDRPTSNYYWGYLTALSFAGLAAAGESKMADGWLTTAQNELSSKVLPEFRDKLRGGGWPEGWQYGEYTTLEIALVAQAFRTGAGLDVASKLPWLGQTVTHHVHALLPDEKSVYDGGTWGEHPARPSGVGLAALGIALEGVDDARAAEARWLTANALPRLTREQAWLALLADRPGAAERPPREGAPTSLHLPGQGLSFVRSDWSRAAVWASFQAGPRLAEDHQDADQGHFGLFRGSDGLLVDGGGSEGSATINHNTLLIDDGGKNLNYPPNQGVWGARVKTTRFGDDGVVAVAVGDIGEAYAPKCASTGCRKRSVEQLTRSFVFVRPGLLVIDDQVMLEEPDYSVTWAAHVTDNPKLAGGLISAVIGASRFDLRTLEPADARQTAMREPTPSGEGSHRLNQPWGPMWRIEVTSPRGSRERGFLHFISAGAAADQPPSARRLSGEGLRGGLTRVADRSVAVLFAGSAGAGRVTLGGPVAEVVVVGLTPGRSYSLQVDAGCALRLAAGSGPNALKPNSGGFLRISAAQCGAQ